MLDIKSCVPEGKRGPWKVEKFHVTEDEIKIFNMRASWHPGGRSMDAGDFTRLTRNGKVIMSDTRAEIRDHWDFLREAQGNVLINGLGLGVCLQILLKESDVVNITVIEQSADVIALVAPSFVRPHRVNIIHANAFDWNPPKGMRYNAVWHDIWDDICSDNLPDMFALHRKYGRRTDWQGSWCRDLCERGR